jgi:gas vesicle protein
MARYNDESAGSGLFLLGALAGALVGAGVALLLAPKAGSQVRGDISSGFNTARDAAARRYRELADKASQKLGYEGKTAAGDRYNGGTGAPVGESYTTNPGTSGYQS